MGISLVLQINGHIVSVANVSLFVVLDEKWITRVIRIHPLWTMNVHVQNFMSIQQVDVEIFHRISWKLKVWWQCRKNQLLTKVTRVPPLGTTNVCTKIIATSSSRCWGISVKAKNVNQLVALKEKSRDHQSDGHTDRQTDITICRSMLLPWRKKTKNE